MVVVEPSGKETGINDTYFDEIRLVMNRFLIHLSFIISGGGFGKLCGILYQAGGHWNHSLRVDYTISLVYAETVRCRHCGPMESTDHLPTTSGIH